MRATIIPDDKTVIIDGVPVKLGAPGGVAMPAVDANVHAIQLYADGHASIENKKGGPAWIEGADAAALVAPFLNAHTAEVARLASIPPSPEPTADERATAEVMSPGVQAIMLAVLERQEAKAAPVVTIDRDGINTRAIEIRKAQIVASG